jgi:hypothetical protein
MKIYHPNRGPPNVSRIPGMKSRAPYITRAGSSRAGTSNIDPTVPSDYRPQTGMHCSVEGAKMVWVPSRQCYYCNICASSQDPPQEEMEALKRAASQANRPLFKTADGSRIFDSEHPTSGNNNNSSALQLEASPYLSNLLT